VLTKLLAIIYDVPLLLVYPVDDYYC